MELVELIAAKQPFTLFANATCDYDGRANSTLERGNYLIIYKNDGSLTIHGCDQIAPRNYLGANAKLSVIDNQLIGKRKKEYLIITIYNIHHCNLLNNWSNAKIQITKTERELVNKLHKNWREYFDIELVSISIEEPTPVGPIDFIGREGNGIHHVCETKRRVAQISAVSQLQRYVDHFREQNTITFGYVASPWISTNAMKHLNKHGFKWIQIGFDEMPQPKLI